MKINEAIKMRIFKKMFGDKDLRNYKIFEGKPEKPIHFEMAKENYKPLSVRDVMLKRVKAVQNGNKKDISFWLNNDFRTVDAVVQYKDQMVIIPYSELLFSLFDVYNFVFPLTENQYGELAAKHGVYKIPYEIYAYCDQDVFTREQIKKHPIWVKLARDDKELLSQYTDMVFDMYERDYRYTYKPMTPFRLRGYPQSNPVIMRCEILSVLFSGSSLDKGILSLKGSTMIGVKSQNLEQIITQ